MPLPRFLRDFCADDSGQDMIEYTIILAVFVFLLFGLAGFLVPSISGMWNNGNARLAAANTSAS